MTKKVQIFHEKLMGMISNEFVSQVKMFIKNLTYQQAKLVKKLTEKVFWALFDDKFFVKNQPKKLITFLI